MPIVVAGSGSDHSCRSSHGRLTQARQIRLYQHIDGALCGTSELTKKLIVVVAFLVGWYGLLNPHNLPLFIDIVAQDEDLASLRHTLTASLARLLALRRRVIECDTTTMA